MSTVRVCIKAVSVTDNGNGTFTVELPEEEMGDFLAIKKRYGDLMPDRDALFAVAVCATLPPVRNESVEQGEDTRCKECEPLPHHWLDEWEDED